MIQRMIALAFAVCVINDTLFSRKKQNFWQLGSEFLTMANILVPLLHTSYCVFLPYFNLIPKYNCSSYHFKKQIVIDSLHIRPTTWPVC